MTYFNGVMLCLGHFPSSSVRVNTWSLTTHTSVIRCVNHTLDMKWIHDALWLMIAGFKSQSWVWCLYFWCPVCHLLFIFGFSPALGLGSKGVSRSYEPQSYVLVSEHLLSLLFLLFVWTLWGGYYGGVWEGFLPAIRRPCVGRHLRRRWNSSACK